MLFHESGSPFVWVGGRGKIYRFNFPTDGKDASVHTVSPGPAARLLLPLPPWEFTHLAR